MRFLPLAIPEVVLVSPEIHADARGHFAEVWRRDAFADAGMDDTWVQENHCRSRRDVLRGLHFQDLRAPQVRLVRCTSGAVWDVAVDLRLGSASFGRHVAAELTGDNLLQVRIPVGFAHGFVVLTAEAEVRYLCSSCWCPEAEGAVRWDDPELAIPWPVRVPILSERDARAPSLAEYREHPAFQA